MEWAIDHKKASTIERNQQFLKHLDPHFGDLSLSQIDLISTEKYKNARTPAEVAGAVKEANPDADEKKIEKLVKAECKKLEEKGLLIKQWDLDFLEADLNWCGRSGSPTKVHRIQSVVLSAKESKDVEASDKGISDMVHELIVDKTLP